MTLLVLLTPVAVLGLFWALQRVEGWMNSTTRPTRTTRTRAAGTTSPAATRAGGGVFT